MRVHCKKMITASLQPLLQKDEKLFQLPGSELVVVLLGPGTAERLQYMVDHLNRICSVRRKLAPITMVS
ncbi:hypothetical protein [Enterobacter cloacae complex sp. ECL112]|uniref:hypothetical protein n=1 Tax=Enterobacter cloacae complex sp. ECL112 TaxID=2850493 RepID=UPI0020B72FF0|nr:hypothetical protein [Enterobacter cloacae complex sp. ECL112]